jgi:hypothetical protein
MLSGRSVGESHSCSDQTGAVARLSERNKDGRLIEAFMFKVREHNSLLQVPKSFSLLWKVDQRKNQVDKFRGVFASPYSLVPGNSRSE